MKKTKVKIPAKLNLTLDVLGKQENYHEIKSLVCSINVYDTVTLTSRDGCSTRLKTKGIDAGCNVVQNNAFITAEKLRKRFGLNGVDIVVDKKIPVGGGLGGSSADIVGVLKAMKEVFKLDCDLMQIASELGSDCVYMLQGGYATMQGRGEIVKAEKIDKKLYFIIVTLPKTISARECYQVFDGENNTPCESTAKAVELLKANDFDGFLATIKNDLYNPAVKILSDIRDNVNMLKAVANGFMTGSGSATFAIFESKKARDKAYKILRPRFGKFMLKAKTV